MMPAIILFLQISTPTFVTDLLGFLLGCAPYVACCCFVVAAIVFRSGGGQNFDLTSGFVKWLFWGIVFLALPSFPALLGALGIHVSMPSATSGGALQPLVAAVSSFTNNYMLGKIVPVAGAALLLKALLDSAEGNSPAPSLISALLVLSINGLFILVQSWNLSSDQYSVADGFMKLVNWCGATVCPAAGALCIVGAIVNYAREKPWGQLALTSLGMLSFSGIWLLVKSWVN